MTSNHYFNYRDIIKKILKEPCVIYAIIFLLTTRYIYADITTSKGSIELDVNADGNPEVTLNGTGLGVGVTNPLAKLHVSGNAIITANLIIGGSTNDSNSNLHIHGSINYSSELVSHGSTQVGSNSFVIVDTVSGNSYLKLPDSASSSNQILTIKKTSTQNSLFISGGGNTFDGLTTLQFPSGNQTYLSLFSSGNEWFILDINQSEAVHLKEMASDNLVVWWKLDETSGNTVTDYSSAANISGTLTNEHQFTGNVVPGTLGTALKLDEKSDTVIHEASSNLSYQSYSYALWFRSSKDTNTIDTDFEISGHAGYVWASSNALYHMSAYHQLTNGNYVTSKIQSTSTLSANSWNHFAVTWDKSSSSLKLYLNGALESGNVASSWMAGANLSLGHPGVAENSEARHDDFRFYNKALTAGEVMTLYQSGNP